MIECFDSKLVRSNFGVLKGLLKYSYEFGADFSLPDSFYEEKLLGLCQYLDEDKAYFLVIKDCDNIVGFLWACELNKNFKRMMHILYFAVLHEYQGKGYGKQLLEEIEKKARKRNVDVLELNVRATNPAIEFYKKMSFCEEHITMTKDLF